MAKFRCVEITVRRFFDADEAQFATQTKVDVVPIDDDGPPDWTGLIESLIDRCGSQIDGAPLTNIREMDQAEAEEYRATEDDTP